MSLSLSRRMFLDGPGPDLCRALIALREVTDPLVGENMLDLGLIESLRLTDDEVELLLVNQAGSCPLSDFLAAQAMRALQRVLPNHDIYVRHDPDLCWAPGRVEPALRLRLGWDRLDCH
ncbi:MAG: iron-sulfur cluster assembly protein [Leptothrix ochracea]|uniref:iron-sulfur cluster assembly protein n=1 Tax=Leptothrix ochracea TaxID=735331 RepID=UPI0034E1DDEC